MGRGDGPSIPIYFATESLRLYVKEGLILNIRLLTGDERFQARLISTVAFHMRMEDPDKAKEESAQETIQDWGAFHEDGTLMAHVINHSFMSFLDGHLIRNGGIGGVSTLPEYRLNGCVREIFKSLLPCAYASGEVISTLYPSDGVLASGAAEGVAKTNMAQLAFGRVLGEGFGAYNPNGI